jgi:hypothetical protein
MQENEPGSAPEMEAPAPAAATVPASEPTTVTDDDYGAVYDRMVTFNGAEKGADGKFVSPKAAQQAQEAPQQALEDAGEETPAEPEAPASEAVSSAPAHLPQSIKGAWDKMPAEARDAIAQWTTEQDRKFGEVGRQLAQSKPLADAVSEFKEYFDGTKGKYQPAEAVRYLFNLQRQMDSRPLDTLLEIADTYGLRQHLTQPTDATRELVALRQTISDLRGQLQTRSNPEDIETTVSAVLEKAKVQEAIDRFAKEQPFYADVEPKLPAFIQMVQEEMPDASAVEVLERAYKKAVYADDKLRPLQISAENNALHNAYDNVMAGKGAAEPKGKAASMSDPKRSQAAKRANSINVTSTGTGKHGYASEAEAMAAAYDRAMAS